METPQRYHVYVDFKGYLIDPASYRAFPAPLMGTRFATGRQAYSNLDFWQVGALTDFTKGINQKFLVDLSSYYYSEGIDISQEGEIRLERELAAVSGFPTNRGIVTARYRSTTTLYLGTDAGWILKSTDGITFSDEKDTGGGMIYGFYEMRGPTSLSPAGDLFAMKGNGNVWRKVGDTWYELAGYGVGQATFTKDSDTVTGSGGASWNAGMTGRRIKNVASGIWYVIKSIQTPTSLTLTKTYKEDTVTGSYAIPGLNDLYFAIVESDYAFGIFADGVRQSLDGLYFTPEPPDPLWALPCSEGVALNAIPIRERGFLIGAKRGLWIFTGGSSAVNLWMFPDYASANNFRGMERFGAYGVFSVEGQGIWYTDGSGVYPTNLNWKEQPFKVTSCKSIIRSGWDMFTLVSDGTYWYLARCNTINVGLPKFWWIVKKLSKIPAMLSALSDYQIFIHYVDATCEVYNKTSGIYQTSGHLISSLIDENLVLLQKFYRDISAILSEFLSDTKVYLGFRLKEEDTFDETEFSGGSDLSITKILTNPTIGNRMQIRIRLTTTNTIKSPVLTDLLWTYILERPKGQGLKKNWHFTVVAEDEIEKLDLDKEELGREIARTRTEIVGDIWQSSAKEEILNFVGADNNPLEALEISYVGIGASCVAKIDRTNYKITTTVDGTLHKTFDYKNLTMTALKNLIDAETDYTASLRPDVSGSESANDLMPDKDLQLKGGALLYLGTDVHAVIFNPQTPGQFKLSWEIEGRGSDRIQVSLREA